jgi:predicted secreted acid phosphatase
MKHRLTVLHLIILSFGLTLIFSQLIYSEPPNLSLVRQEVINYHDSGFYQQELTNKIKQAQNYIIQQVLLNKKNKHPQKLALVLDIDETSLSNYDNIVKHNFTGTRKLIHKEILAANSPAIKPTLALYKNAMKHGIKIFFITGRSESERAATQKNLIKAGYTNWSGLYLRPNHYALPSIISFKSNARAIISKQGYTIIASIGDQYSDIRGGYTQNGFKLPNPFYYLP